MSAITINATNTFTDYTIPSDDSNDIIISFCFTRSDLPPAPRRFMFSDVVRINATIKDYYLMNDEIKDMYLYESLYQILDKFEFDQFGDPAILPCNYYRDDIISGILSDLMKQQYGTFSYTEEEYYRYSLLFTVNNHPTVVNIEAYDESRLVTFLWD